MGLAADFSGCDLVGSAAGDVEAGWFGVLLDLVPRSFTDLVDAVGHHGIVCGDVVTVEVVTRWPLRPISTLQVMVNLLIIDCWIHIGFPQRSFDATDHAMLKKIVLLKLWCVTVHAGTNN